MDFSDAQLSRYSRHILLDGIGIEGQQALARSRVLVIGAGGLGCPVALYLAASGVGCITLVDHDTVDLTNLQRQIGHSTERVGELKVESLRKACLALNPEVEIAAVAQRADAALLDELVPKADVVVDCTDNFRTRHAINAACVKHRVPLVSGAAVQMDAQLSVFDPRDPSSPCYACAFEPLAEGDESVDQACATMGVLAPLVGMVGSMQAAQVLALITGCAKPLVGSLLMWDAQTFEMQRMKLAKRADCQICAQPVAN